MGGIRRQYRHRFTMSDPKSSRFALPWQAFVASTVLALTAAVLVFVFVDDLRNDEATDPPAESVELRPLGEVPEGDPLDIEYTDVDGTTATLRERLGNQPLVVNFFASWCPPCVAEMPDFEAVSQDLEGVEFFGLAVTDRPEDASRIVEQTGITYPWSRDKLGDIAAGFGVTTMPSTLFIAPDGKITHIRPGAVDQDRLRDLIEEHLGVTT